ncbi:putative selenate ABC transporter substrate-binding protein [Halovibrio salipaludis]|uniref:Putative selenate ABC transporter substrate-binding protein n=1 Tax=Halovibrio salipaludis TaxID=2032626 RepID=A0A2A2FBT4_9GAMM|nr:putative selenate ABC transporter substrate-binding protein [Halovibrio salipaludis]PAU82428.1 putative selenate ABC transporter substrate-binding protein [Halovibrio salipaludis]
MRWITGLLAALMMAAPAMAESTLYFTAIPDEDETSLEERFSKVADYLENELDVPVQFIPVKSYAASVTTFRNNQVQLAWFGGLSGVRARQAVPGSEAIAQGAEDQEFRSYFIAHESTGIEPTEGKLPEALKGKTLTFGSRGSTSGRLMPEHYIRERFGSAPGEVFSRVGFSGNHTRTAKLVESGAYQVGVLNYTVWDKMVENNEIDTDQVQIIWTSPTYPDYQWTIRGDVNERFGDGFKERVQQALLNMENPELLESFPRSSFIPASNDDYETIKRVGEETGLLD